MIDALQYLPPACLGGAGGLCTWFATREWSSLRAKVDTVADNHLTHVQADLALLVQKQDLANVKSDRIIEVLEEVAKGIAVLVDRGHR